MTRGTRRAKEAVLWLEKKGNRATRDGMARYAIASHDAFGERLARSPEPPARWVGKDALRELTSPPLKKRLARKG